MVCGSFCGFQYKEWEDAKKDSRQLVELIALESDPVKKEKLVQTLQQLSEQIQEVHQSLSPSPRPDAVLMLLPLQTERRMSELEKIYTSIEGQPLPHDCTGEASLSFAY